MKYLIVIIYASIVLIGCGDKSIIESHKTMHESDIVPFTYEAKVESETLTLRVAPDKIGEVLYPFHFIPNDQIIEDDKMFLGDLVLSTAKIGTDITYIHIVEGDKIVTIMDIDISYLGTDDLLSQQGDLAIKICNECTAHLNIKENNMAHFRGHIWGSSHYHISIPD